MITELRFLLDVRLRIAEFYRAANQSARFVLATAQRVDCRQIVRSVGRLRESWCQVFGQFDCARTALRLR